MTKPAEDYVLTPESEGSEKKQILWNKWREGFKKSNKELAECVTKNNKSKPVKKTK